DARALPPRRFSFDMLGEGARTAQDADRNFRRTMDAIRAMERAVGARETVLRERLEVSVKLSSIHPRYDAASHAQVRGELLGRLKQISGRAAAAGIGVTIDAEGSESFSLQLDLFGAMAAPPLPLRGSSVSASTEWEERCTSRSQLRIRMCRCARMHPSARSASCLPTWCAACSKTRRAARMCARRHARNDPMICWARVSNVSTRARARVLFPYQRSGTCRHDG